MISNIPTDFFLHGFKSGDRLDQPILPRKEIKGRGTSPSKSPHRTSRSVGCCSILLKPNIVSIVKFIQFGFRKVYINTQYRSALSHWDIVFKKVRTQTAQFCYCPPYDYMRTVQWAFVKLTGVVLGPIPEVSLIHASTHVKMGLVTEIQQQHGGHVVQFPNTIFCDSLDKRFTRATTRVKSR